MFPDTFSMFILLVANVTNLLILLIFYVLLESQNNHLSSEYSIPGLVPVLQSRLYKGRITIHIKHNYIIFYPDQSISFQTASLGHYYNMFLQMSKHTYSFFSHKSIFSFDSKNICLYSRQYLSFDPPFIYLPFFKFTLIDLINSL